MYFNKLRLLISIIFWRILKNSIVFNYWYKKHLSELLYDLELYDLEKNEITLKWRNRYNKP